MYLTRNPFLPKVVSKNQAGEIGNNHSPRSALNGYGDVLAFDSMATNLVPGDTNNSSDVFVREKNTGVIERVSIHTNGTQGNTNSNYPDIDTNGLNVAFTSSGTSLSDVDSRSTIEQIYLHNRTDRSTTMISLAPDGNSGNGLYVIFESRAWNLTAKDENFRSVVFALYDKYYDAPTSDVMIQLHQYVMF